MAKGLWPCSMTMLYSLRAPNEMQAPGHGWRKPLRHVADRGWAEMAKPLVSDELWELIEPLIPKVRRRHRFAGRKRLDDRRVLTGILFVLRTGIPWEYLPQEMGCGSGMTCWRRLREWQQAGVWQQLHELLLAKLQKAERIDWSRAAIDSSHVRAFGGAPRLGRARSTAPEGAPSTI